MKRAHLPGFVLALAFGLVAWQTGRAPGDENNGSQAPAPPATPPASPARQLPPFTPANEQEALAFVQKHHPEMEKVVTRLAEVDRGQYKMAIREIYSMVERVAITSKTNPALGDLLLQHWVLQSDIELLAARLALLEDPDPDQEAQLLKLITEKVELERRTVEFNRDRMQAQVDAMNRSIEAMRTNRDEIIERRFNMMKNSAKRSSRSTVKPPPPAIEPSTPLPPGVLITK